MFKEINKELEELQQGIYRCQKIDSMLRSLNEQLRVQEKNQRELELVLKKENLDVEKLSKMSVASVFYTILGSKEKQIEKERQEAIIAQLRLGDINMQITDTNRQIYTLQSELKEIGNSERKYKELFQKKYEMLKQNNSQNIDKIIELENKTASYKSNLKEINEAVSVGNSVLQSLDKVRESLNSAQGWGTWDMLGGGILTDIVKHGHIDDAKNAASDVQMLLNRFRTELTDVRVPSSITINVEGFVKFADYFFDGLFSDWMVQSRIHDSQKSVNNVDSEVHGVLYRLSKMQDEDKTQIAVLENERSQIIVNA